MEGIESVVRAGFTGLKLDTVVIRGFNDDELVALIEFGKQVQAEVRFIEYMDVGGANDWSQPQVLSRAAMLTQLSGTMGSLSRCLSVERRRLSDICCRMGRHSGLFLQRPRRSVARAIVAGSPLTVCGITVCMPRRGRICERPSALVRPRTRCGPCSGPAGKAAATEAPKSARRLNGMGCVPGGSSVSRNFVKIRILKCTLGAADVPSCRRRHRANSC
jgi:Molybdenum cofactor biosynthesis enzyme